MKRLLLWLWRVLPMTYGVRFRALWLLNQKFLVGVAGVVVDDLGRVLLLKHTYRAPHQWGLPSGWVQRGEGPREAIVRELKEEVGLPVRVLSVLEVEADPVYPRVDLTLVCRPDGPVGDLRPLDREIERAGFFRPDEFPGPLPPPQPDLIRRALASLGF